MGDGCRRIVGGLDEIHNISQLRSFHIDNTAIDEPGHTGNWEKSVTMVKMSSLKMGCCIACIF